MRLLRSKSFTISNCYRRGALDEVSEQNNSNDHDKIEEIRQDNIEAANKYQSKYRRRMVVEDTDSAKQKWPGT
jgi:hypothetical protein